MSRRVPSAAVVLGVLLSLAATVAPPARAQGAAPASAAPAIAAPASAAPATDTAAAPADAPEADALEAEIDRLLGAHRFDDAREAALRLRALLAAAAVPEARRLQEAEFWVGLLAHATGRWAQAEEAFARAEANMVAVYPDDRERRYRFALVRQARALNLIQLGAYQRAARVALAGLADREAVAPGDVRGRFDDLMTVARAFSNLEEWAEARTFLARAFNLVGELPANTPESEFALLVRLIQQTLLELGEPRAAHDIAADYLAGNRAEGRDVGADDRALMERGRVLALLDLGDVDGALALARSALDEAAGEKAAEEGTARGGTVEDGGPTRRRAGSDARARLHHALGRAARRAGRWDEADVALRRADLLFTDNAGPGDLDRLEVLVDRVDLALAVDDPVARFGKLFSELAERLRTEAAGMALGRSDWHRLRLRRMRALTRRAIDLLADAQAVKPVAQWVGNVVAFHLAQLARFGETGAAIGEMAARLSAGDDALAGLIRRRAAATAERDDTLHRLAARAGAAADPAAASGPGTTGPGTTGPGKTGSEAGANAPAPDAQAALRARLEALDAEVAAIDVRLAADHPAFGELANPTVVDWKRIAGTMQPYPREVLLFYFVGERHSLVWAFNGGGLGLRAIPAGRAELEEKVRRLRESVDATGISTLDDLRPFDLALARELHGLLVAPTKGIVDDRTRHLVIVPDGPLTALPFEVLVEGPPPAGEVDGKAADERAGDGGDRFARYRDVAWLGARVGISVSPTVSAFVVLREAAGASAAPEPFLGVGDPLVGDRSPDGGGANGTGGTARGVGPLARLRAAGVAPGALFRDGRGDVDALRRLPALPDTAEELAGIARSLGAGDDALLLRERATERVVRGRDDLDRFRVLAFATHGVMAGEIDGATEPALVLTPPAEASADDDGLLSAGEIGALALDADWVILSACNTAAPDGRPGAPALSGLARAFFLAGARALLVSHWSVVSDAASLYTREMLAARAAGPVVSRAEAARRAKVRVMTDPERPYFAHPIFWAPFSVVGDGWRRPDPK